MRHIISVLSVSLVVLAGCASYPAAVKVENEASLVSYQAAVKGGISNGPARWSGVIAKVQNNSADTRLEVVYFPSSSNGRPQSDKDTAGRFVAYAQGFLDPVVYQPGKQVTILGQLAPFEQGKVDQYQYNFPVLQQAVVHLWPKQAETTRVEMEPFPLWRQPYPYYWGPAVRIRTTTIPTPTQGPVHVQSEQGSQQR